MNAQPKKILVWSLIIVLLIVIGVAYKTYHLDRRNKIDESKPSEQLLSIRTNERIKVSAINTSFVTIVEGLPEVLRSLLVGSATHVNVKDVAYADNTNGFQIDSTVNDNTVLAVYNELLMKVKSGWRTVYASRSADAALINLENSEYLVVANFLKKDETNVLVKYFVIRKQLAATNSI